MTAHYAEQSDPNLNRQFRRRWAEPADAIRLPVPALPAVPEVDANSGDDADGAAVTRRTLLAWRDQWRQGRP